MLPSQTAIVIKPLDRRALKGTHFEFTEENKELLDKCMEKVLQSEVSVIPEEGFPAVHLFGFCPAAQSYVALPASSSYNRGEHFYADFHGVRSLRRSSLK